MGHRTAGERFPGPPTLPRGFVEPVAESSPVVRHVRLWRRSAIRLRSPPKRADWKHPVAASPLLGPSPSMKAVATPGS